METPKAKQVFRQNNEVSMTQKLTVVPQTYSNPWPSRFATSKKMFSRLLIILQKINNHGFQPWLVYSTEFHDFFWERYKIKDKSESPASMVITLGRFGIQDEICSTYYVLFFP